MIQSIKDTLAKLGFAFIPNFYPEKNAIVIANGLGIPLTPWEGGLVQELVPRASATPNTYSGIYGLNKFPFHTDLASWQLPPRYLLLRCLVGYTDVPTQLVDGQTLMEVITPDLLARAVFKPRRPREGRLTLLRICEPTNDGHRLRWDDVFIKPASKIGKIADLRIREWLAICEPRSIALAQTGDTLLIDNWRILHARSSISAGHEGRKIARVYLEDLR